MDLFKTQLFSKDEVNTGRQWSFDAAKAMAILFMVLVHSFIYIYGEENMDHGFQYCVNNIYGGVFAAPVFMFCMGVGVAYSRRNDSRTMFVRGLKLIVAGFLLNIVRCLPPLLLWKSGYGEEYSEAFLEELCIFDILHFAGFAFILFALLRLLKASSLVILLVGLALSVFGSYVRFIDMGSTTLNLLCYPFVGVHADYIWSSFPLANWFIFVAAGYWFGIIIRHCTDLDRFYAILTPFTAFFLITATTYMTTHTSGMFNDASDDYFYYQTPVDSIVCILATLTFVGIGHFFMPHEPHAVQHTIQVVSSDVTRIYLIHWVFISYMISGLFSGVLNLSISEPVMLLVAVAILDISAWLARRKPFSLIKI